MEYTHPTDAGGKLHRIEGTGMEESMTSLILLILIFYLLTRKRSMPTTPTQPVRKETPAQQRDNEEFDELEDSLHDLDGTL